MKSQWISAINQLPHGVLPVTIIIVLQVALFASTVSGSTGSSQLPDDSVSNIWAIELTQPSDGIPVAVTHGCQLVRRLHLISHFALVSCGSGFINSAKSDTLTQRFRRHASVIWAERQVAKRRVKRSASDKILFNDPFYDKQWYLLSGANGGHDLEVSEVWKMGYTGRGSVVSILDDGVEHWHSDLKDNYDPAASYDVNGHDSDPSPRQTPNNENRHGTRCAGEVAAKANNGICAVGIAFESRIGGIRMLDGQITDSVEAESLGYNQGHIDIYSASWGPDDDGRTVDGPGRLAKQAFLKGITSGRNGLGNIFVWASGNGGHKADSCACDGYTNSVYTLSVSSITQRNSKPWYLEECASTLAATYSSGGAGEDQVVTTDLRNQCTSSHTGTSASAPIAAAILALVLEANRNLTWRDVQHLTVISANPGQFLFDAEWLINSAGLRHSRRYGFGLMSAFRMVSLARLWARPVSKMLRCQCQRVKANQPVPNTGALSIAVLVSPGGGCACDGAASSSILMLESVQLHLDASFSNRGQLQVTLISPSGTRSLLLTPRIYDDHNGDCGFQAWPLMSVQFWRENPTGKWQVLVENRGSPSNRGRVASATLVLYGTDREPVLLRRPADPLPEWLTPWISLMKAEPVGPVGCHRLCSDTDNCTGPGPGDCRICRFYRRPLEGCVEACQIENGEYSDADSRTCRPCHPACVTCRGPGNGLVDGGCLSCRSDSIALLSDSNNNSTLLACLTADSDCPPAHYSLTVAMETKTLTSTKQTELVACAPCPIGCTDCKLINNNAKRRSLAHSRLRPNCTACLPGYLLLLPDGVCHPSSGDCPHGYWLATDGADRCLPCRDPNCERCRPNGIDCLSCRAPTMPVSSSTLELAGDSRVGCVDPATTPAASPCSMVASAKLIGCSVCLVSSLPAGKGQYASCILCQAGLVLDPGPDNAKRRCLAECPQQRPHACPVVLNGSLSSRECSAVPCPMAILPGPCSLGRFATDIKTVTSSFNATNRFFTCSACHSSCRTCVGSGPNNCSSCWSHSACLSRGTGRCLACGRFADCDPLYPSQTCQNEAADSNHPWNSFTVSPFFTTSPSAPTQTPPGGVPRLSPISAVYGFAGLVLGIVLVCLAGYYYCVGGAANNNTGSAGSSGGINSVGGSGLKCSYSPVSQKSPSASPERAGTRSHHQYYRHQKRVVCADSPSPSASPPLPSSPEKLATSLQL